MLAGPARLSGWVAVAHAVLPTIVLFSTGVRMASNDSGQLIAGYRAGAWLRGVPAYASLAVLSGGLFTCALVMGADLGHAVLVAAKAGVLPWLVGRYTTARRSYLAELEKRSELEQRDAKAAVTKAITEERSAIARDLHDVIAHHVSAIGVHAGAARLGLQDGNERLTNSLRSVETASRAAMVDLRHLLDLLHGDKTEGARQPGLDNVDELLDGVRSAGTPARLQVRGQRRDVPESLDCSPRASVRCCSWSRRRTATRRSPPGCTSGTRRSRRTFLACFPSWDCVIGCMPAPTHTSTGWYDHNVEPHRRASAVRLTRYLAARQA